MFIYTITWKLSGSSGLGSVSRDDIEMRSFAVVRAGDQAESSMSRHTVPRLLMLGWKIRVTNFTRGALWRVGEGAVA